MERIVAEYAELFRSTLTEKQFPEIDSKVSQYRCRLETMYASETSEAYRKHNAYPMINVERVYAVVVMCLELKTYNDYFQNAKMGG